MIVIDAIKTEEYKTKTMVKMLSDVGAAKKALVVIPEKDDKVYRSLGNIPGVTVAYPNTLNVYDILNSTSLVIAQDAARKIEEVYDK